MCGMSHLAVGFVDMHSVIGAYVTSASPVSIAMLGVCIDLELQLIGRCRFPAFDIVRKGYSTKFIGRQTVVYRLRS